MTLAAGMACEGAKPVVAIYSTFLQRGYDQLVHDVAIQNLDVLFAIDRGGVVGPDGATHAGNLDLSYLRCVPNMVVMAPADENECRQMLSTGYRYDGPAAVRYPRGTGPGVAVQPTLDTLPIGKAELRRHGFAHRPARLRRDRAGGGKGRRGTRPDRRQHALRQAAGSRADPGTGDATTKASSRSRTTSLPVVPVPASPNCWPPKASPCRSCTWGCPTQFQHHASREQLLAEAGLDADGIRAAVLQRWPQLAAQQPRSAAI